MSTGLAYNLPTTFIVVRATTIVALIVELPKHLHGRTTNQHVWLTVHAGSTGALCDRLMPTLPVMCGRGGVNGCDAVTVDSLRLWYEPVAAGQVPDRCQHWR